MRAEEWMNDGVDFFPFLLDDASAPVLLNKRELVALTVPASADRDRTLEASPAAASVVSPWSAAAGASKGRS